MPISLVKQYSIFVINKPGALANFAALFTNENVNIVALSQDVRYDAAVVRLAVVDDNNISHILTKAGLTSVKTDAICLDIRDRVGIAKELGQLLGDAGINITSMYGSSGANGYGKWIIVVNNLPQAIKILQSSKLFD